MSMDQALFMASMSKPSRSNLILPQESQFGGTRTLSRSITLCLRGCRFNREWIPSEEWTRLCKGLVTEGVVYIREAPSVFLLAVFFKRKYGGLAF